MNRNSPADYDVVIVGAGIVGLTLACSLIDKDIKLAIVNKSIDFTDKATADFLSDLRVIAITLGSQQLLEKLQVWQRLDAKRLTAFRTIQIDEPAKEANLFFDSADLGQATLGYIIKNYDLQDALSAQLKTAKELTWLAPDTLIDINLEKNRVLLTLASGMKMSTSLVVGADGAESKVRQLAGISIKASDYHQRALIATVQTELAHAQIARQIFLPTGPLAFLPLADPYYSSIVWSTTPNEARRLEELADPQFCSELSNAFEQRLGRIISTSTRLSFPLKLQEAQQYIKSSVAVVGDAAHISHPLAGQGANLGIADAECLARVILEAKQKQRSLGAVYTLRAYERERRFHNRLMNGSIDGIKTLFATNNPLLLSTRQLGLNFINKAPFLKNYIARYAMGNLCLSSLSRGFNE